MGFAYGRALQDCPDLDNEKILHYLHPALFLNMTQTNTVQSALEKLSQRKTTYRTRPVEVRVEFADHEQLIETLEGPVVCHPGDAIVTGSRAERWPQSRGGFSEKYEPVQGHKADADGCFTKRIKTKEAAQIHEPFTVELSNGRGSLTGKPGDWCVWNSSEDLFIVARDIFPELYEPETVTVYVELAKELTNEEMRSALQVIHSLDAMLPHSNIVYSKESSETSSGYPIWFRFVQSVSGNTTIVRSVLELPIGSLTSDTSRGVMLGYLKNATTKESVPAFSLQKFLRLFKSGERAEAHKTDESKKKDAIESAQRVIAWQLAAVENFNAELKSNWSKQFQYPFVENRDVAVEPYGLKKAYRIGEIADDLAKAYQEKWQKLVFATTNDIADKPTIKRLQGLHSTLVTLGIFAAVMLAAFSELGGTCDRSDPWGFEFCASDAWRHWAKPVLFFSYFAALSFAWIRYVKAKTGKWEVQHQDFRLLAECIRVLHVRTLLGKPACVGSDLPLAVPTDSGWVRLALQSIYFDAKHGGLQNSCDDMTKVNLAIRTFVSPQITYSETKLLVRREQAAKKLTSVSHLGLNFFIAVLFIIAANVVAEAFFHRAFLTPMMDHVALISLVLGLGTWGGMRKVIDSLGLEQEIQRGKLVLSYLATAENAGTNDVITEAADYFLDDQSHWHALHRSKPIEAVTGG